MVDNAARRKIMRQLLCVTFLVALVALCGCADKAPAPDETAQPGADAPEETQPIATEDFESGEVEEGAAPEAVEGAEAGAEDVGAEAAEETVEGGGH
jgi:hypothetical protein